MRQRRRGPAPAPLSPARHRSRPAARWLVPMLLVLCTQAASFSLPVPASLAAAAVKMPFAAGAEWYISQGYNTSPAEGWSHYNCDSRTGEDEISKTERCDDGWQYKYSVDLRQVDGTEAGETVLSPVDGTIRWLDPANGGLSIDMGNGFAAAIFHLDLARGLADGQPLVQGQPLGVVSGPGGGNNGGTPHIHFNLWATEDGGNWSRTATPFTGRFALDGYDLPDLGDQSRNHHWNTVLVSTNQQIGDLPGVDGTPAATPAATPGPTPLAPPPASGGATINLAAARVIAGTLLTINGAGFAPDEWVDLYWDSSRGVPLTEVTANEVGAWTTAVTIPEAVAGPHRIIAEAETSGQNARGAVEVIPALAPDPVGGAAGAQVAVRLTGFAATEQVALRWGGDDGQELTSVTTNEVGSGATTFTIPDGGTGPIDLVAFGQSSRGRALATIRVDGGAAAGVVAGGNIIGPGTFQVTATVLGLVGGSTSSGHVIQADDRLVALPACTTTSCPWLPAGVVDPLFGSRIECGELCYVRVTSPASGRCAVAPVLETGPWFTLDDWWNPAESRILNNLPSTVQPLAQGYPAAAAAQDGLDVGFGRTPSGIGISNKGYEVGNRAAIDLATGTWQDVGFDPNSGVGEVVVTLLWLTGEDPASAAATCGAATPEASTPIVTTPEATDPASTFSSPEAAATVAPQSEPSPTTAPVVSEAPPPIEPTAEPPPDPAAEAPAEDQASDGERAARREAKKLRDRFGR